MTGPLRNIVDLDEAYDAWRATCGPTALAAALDLERVNDLRDAFAPFPGYCTITKMREAIARAGAKVHRSWTRPSAEVFESWKTPGPRLVLMLQFSGPWNDIPRAAARYRHCVAIDRAIHPTGHAPVTMLWVGDINVPTIWSPWPAWRSRDVPELAPKRWDGELIITWAAEVSR